MKKALYILWTVVLCMALPRITSAFPIADFSGAKDVSGALAAEDNRTDKAIVPLLLSYQTDKCYIRDGDIAERRKANNEIQYEINLERQFYDLKSVSISFQKDQEHTVFLLDDGFGILAEIRPKAGEIRIFTTSDMKYITVASPVDEEIIFSGKLSETGLQVKEKNKILNNPYEGKYLSVLGDSMSAYWHYTPKYPAYPLDDVEHVTQMWWYILAKDLGMNICKVNAYAGSGVSDLGTPEKIASSGRGKELDMNGELPDLVIVMIGANDFFKKVDIETVRVNYTKTIQDIRSAYPKAEIFLTTYPHGSLQEGNELLREIAHSNNVEIIELDCPELLKSIYYIDGVHYNSAGMKQVALKIEKELLK